MNENESVNDIIRRIIADILGANTGVNGFYGNTKPLPTDNKKVLLVKWKENIAAYGF